MHVLFILGFPGGTSSKEPACQFRRPKRLKFNLWVRRIPSRRTWQSTPVFLPRESHGQRSLTGCGPWGREEQDTTQWLTQLTHKYSVYSNSLMRRYKDWEGEERMVSTGQQCMVVSGTSFMGDLCEFQPIEWCHTHSAATPPYHCGFHNVSGCWSPKLGP